MHGPTAQFLAWSLVRNTRNLYQKTKYPVGGLNSCFHPVRASDLSEPQDFSYPPGLVGISPVQPSLFPCSQPCPRITIAGTITGPIRGPALAPCTISFVPGACTGAYRLHPISPAAWGKTSVGTSGSFWGDSRRQQSAISPCA